MEFAHLAMDEIDLAMRIRRAEVTFAADPSTVTPTELRGMTAVSSEAGSMGSRIASTKGQKGRDASGDFDVVDSSVTLAEKGAVAVKFKCGVNASTDENKGT